MAIVAVLLLIAVVSFLLFLRTWFQAARAQPGPTPRPPDIDHLSKTRAVAGDPDDSHST
jgi:hypothetical protein